MKILSASLFLCALSCFIFIAVDTSQGQQMSSEINPQAVLDDGSREIVNINGSFYYVGPPGLYFTAYDAVTLCNDIGMRLVSLQTEEKYTEIVKFMVDNNRLDYYWSSGIRYAAKNFIWSGTGEEFTYTNWWTFNPNETSTTPDVCVLFYSSGVWEDFPCSRPTCVMCEEQD